MITLLDGKKPTTSEYEIKFHCVAEFVCRFGVPDIIHTDQGKIFDLGLIKKVCQLLAIKKQEYDSHVKGLAYKLW